MQILIRAFAWKNNVSNISVFEEDLYREVQKWKRSASP